MGALDDFSLRPLKRLKHTPSSSDIRLEEASSESPSSSFTSIAKVDHVMNDMEDCGEDLNVGPTGLIRRSELLKVITQALQALGYGESASRLQKEAGIQLESQVISNFRQQVLDGQWDDAIASIQLLRHDPQSYNMAAALILEQKYFELIQKRDIVSALEILRLEISPLNLKEERLHDLATCLVSPSRVEHLFLSGRVKKQAGSMRENLLLELQAFIPPSIMIPERRLEHLIEQALIVQRDSCIFHNSVDQPLSLFSDHQCGRDQIPNQTLQVLDTHEDEVWFLQFSHNGAYLASASKDHTAVIWEVVPEGLVKWKHTLTGHANAVSFTAWSPDDTMILTCVHNQEVVKLWDAESGECKHTYEKASSTNDFTACAAWFPDGKTFICSGSDKCIYIWDIEGREVDVWQGICVPRISDLAITADGKHMICICEKDIRIFNLKTKAEQIINEDQCITSLSVSKDGRYLLVNLVSQEIHLRDLLDDGKLLIRYSGHRQTRYVIRSCFGGYSQSFIVSGSEDSQVYIWHRKTGQILEVLPGHSGTVNCLSWNPADPYMFASASDDHMIRIWGTNDRAEMQRIQGVTDSMMHLDPDSPSKHDCFGHL